MRQNKVKIEFNKVDMLSMAGQKCIANEVSNFAAVGSKTDSYLMISDMGKVLTRIF